MTNIRTALVVLLLLATAALAGCDSGNQRRFRGEPPPRRKAMDLAARQRKAPSTTEQVPAPEEQARAAESEPSATSPPHRENAVPADAPTEATPRDSHQTSEVSKTSEVLPATGKSGSHPSAGPKTSPPPEPARETSVPVVARAQTPIQPLPPPADLARDAELKWISPLGEGGVVVTPPPEPDVSAPEDSLTDLAAVIFPEGADRDILFVGTADPDRPAVTRRELLDAFVLAYRALGQAAYPGVSIDPRPGQLSGGLREGDLMDVVYFGDSANSEMGFAAFEADRLMKCLSMAKDNLTGKPMTCRVAGYRSELDLSSNRRSDGKSSWHRFWIEMGRSDVRRTSDGRTWMVEAKLAVNTEYMEAKGGKLVPGKRAADPAAKQFAGHLARHYPAYAREFPAFARLAAFAAVTSVAAAVYEDQTAAALRQALEETWRLHEHRIQQRPTPATTPATVATAVSDVSPNQQQMLQLTGGVRLKPENQYRPAQADTAGLPRAIEAARPKDSFASRWDAEFAGASYRVLQGRARRARRVWQEDLRVGTLALVRQWGPRDGLGQSTPGWHFRMPRVRMAEEIVSYDGGQRAPRAAYFYDEDGSPIVLPQFGTVTLPGNPPTPSFSSADGNRRLCLYKNAWLYLEGKVDFVSVNNSPPTMRLGPGARVVRFSPSDSENHRVEDVQGPQGTVRYGYDGARLASVQNQQSDAIRLRYNEQGRLSGLEGGGRRIYYHYDAEGRLRYLSDDRGSTLAYGYGRSSPEPMVVSSQWKKTPAAEHQPAAQVLIQPDSKNASWTVNDPQTRYVSVDRVPGPGDGYDLAIQGGPAPQAAPRQLPTHYTSAMAGKLAADLLADPAVQAAKTVVLGGDLQVTADLAVALRKAAPQLAVFSTESPESAQRNLYGPPTRNGKTRVLVYEEGLDGSVRRAIEPFRADVADAGAVILVGHNQPGFLDFVRKQGNAGAYQGRDVILLTCYSADMPGEVANMLRSYGAVSVTGFAQPIRQQLLPLLVEGITSRLAREPPAAGAGARRKDATIESVVRETTQEILDRKTQDDRGESEKDAGKPQRERLPAAIQRGDIEQLILYEQVYLFRKVERNRLATLGKPGADGGRSDYNSGAGRPLAARCGTRFERARLAGPHSDPDRCIGRLIA